MHQGLHTVFHLRWVVGYPNAGPLFFFFFGRKSRGPSAHRDPRGKQGVKRGRRVLMTLYQQGAGVTAFSALSLPLTTSSSSTIMRFTSDRGRLDGGAASLTGHAGASSSAIMQPKKGPAFSHTTPCPAIQQTCKWQH
jgi:hypothetical protein